MACGEMVRLPGWPRDVQHNSRYYVPMKLLIGAAAVVAAAAGWLLLRPRKEVPPASIVLLLDKPRAVGVHALAEYFTAASGRPVSAVAADGDNLKEAVRQNAGDFVAGASPHFIANIGGTTFVVH